MAENRGLRVAISRIEATLATDRRGYVKPTLQIGGVNTERQNQLTYLGLEIDRRPSLNHQSKGIETGTIDAGEDSCLANQLKSTVRSSCVSLI